MSEKERTLPFLFGNLGNGLDGGFNLCFGVESTQAKSDCSVWKSPNGAMG
jgi:hypothetical protein